MRAVVVSSNMLSEWCGWVSLVTGAAKVGRRALPRYRNALAALGHNAQVQPAWAALP
jgi:hypothetical protein